jgi:hypothetical protein
MIAGTSIGYFGVVDGTGNDTIDASGISNGILAPFFQWRHRCVQGRNGNDAFVVAAADSRAIQFKAVPASTIST